MQGILLPLTLWTFQGAAGFFEQTTTATVTTMNIQQGEPADTRDAFKPGPLFGSILSPVAKVIPHRGGRYGVFSAAGMMLDSFDDFHSAALACRAWPQAAAVHPLGAAELRR